MEKQYVIVCLYGETYRFLMDRPYLPATLTDQFMLAKRFATVQDAQRYINEDLAQLDNFIAYESDVIDEEAKKFWNDGYHSDWKEGTLTFRPFERTFISIKPIIREVKQEKVPLNLWTGTICLVPPEEEVKETEE